MGGSSLLLVPSNSYQMKCLWPQHAESSHLGATPAAKWIRVDQMTVK
jgi:hypothetical protein